MGPYTKSNVKEKGGRAGKPSRFLALHLRFEIDMVAHSLCEYGGGEEERKVLEAYRAIHFPSLAHLEKTKGYYAVLQFFAVLLLAHIHLCISNACLNFL